MIIRQMKYSEVMKYQWKFYRFDIEDSTTKMDIINFYQSKMIAASGDKHVFIDPLSTNIIIITKKGEKILGDFNHIYKNNNIKIKIGEKWHNFSSIKNKIKTIYFMDDIIYHDNLKSLWNDEGFNYDVIKVKETRQKLFETIN